MLFLCWLWLIVKVPYKWVTIGYFNDIMWLITWNSCQIQTIRSQLHNFNWIVGGDSYIANYISKRKRSCDNVTYWFICLTPINNESQCFFYINYDSLQRCQTNESQLHVFMLQCDLFHVTVVKYKLKGHLCEMWLVTVILLIMGHKNKFHLTM